MTFRTTSSVNHTQCLLKKGNTTQVSWIPSFFAVKGKFVKLGARGTDKKDWDDGWEIIETWSTKSTEEIDDFSQDYKKQHRASDAYRDKDGHWVTPKQRQYMSGYSTQVALSNYWEDFLPKDKEGFEKMSNLKMYILVKKSVPVGLGVNSVGHTSLATYLKFKDDPVLQAWLTSKHFRKVTCVVSDEEFEQAKTYSDHVIMTENALVGTANDEIAIGFKPREEWPPFFKSLKLFGSHLKEKE